jgi:hypothetical protein
MKPEVLVIYVPNGEIIRFDINSKCDYGIENNIPYIIRKGKRINYINMPYRYEENASN